MLNIDSLPERISEDEFADFIGNVLIHERIDDLFSEDAYYDIYKGYGFESVRHDIRPLLRLKKVKHIFIFKSL